MKIEIEGAIIKFIPETQREAEELDALWKLVARCDEENRKILPLGVYVPGSSPYAQFYVEGLKTKAEPERVVRKVRYVCMICNRMEEYPESAPNPVCCGQPMYCMD